ncbi:MAG: hypothetical protein ACRED5_23005 [Propylenella sp.]
MTIRRTIAAATFAFALPLGAAHAEGLQPIEGQSIHLGEVSGVAYYTVEHDGFRLVATLAEGEAGTPLRIEATLASGQSLVLSTPREAGTVPKAVEISRRGDQILVHEVALTN